MKNIAVIGATGMLGIPVVVELVKAGFEVTALVRNPSSAKLHLPEEIKLVQADVADVESLKRGLSGQDAVYLSLSITPTEKKDDFHTEVEGLENILAAAHFAGVARIAYLSAMIQDGKGNDWWVVDVWRSAIAQIKRSGIPYTIFYPTNFMEVIPQRHVLGGFLALIGTPRYANYWIAGRDYGAQVAASFLIAEANHEYFVQGPEPLTYDQVADRFAKSFRTKLLVVKIPMKLLTCLSVFSQAVHFTSQIMGAVLRYPEEFKAADTWKALGKPSTTIEDFARSLPR